MKKKDISIVYMGTPDFAVPTLEALNNDYNVLAVVTLPDQLKGRGKHLLPSDVKVKAEELGLRILQPRDLRSERFINEMTELNPDIIVVVAFRILPPEIYSLAKLGAFNIHGSILPKYRGAAPINWAVINGDKTTGITSFLLKEKVDTGDILLTKETRIGNTSTFGDVYNDLKELTPILAKETINLIASGNYTPKEQSDEEATQAPKLFPEQCQIDWNQPARVVKNFINGTSPTPGAWTMLRGQRVKILRADLESGNKLEVGQYEITKHAWKVGCESDYVQILELQFPGKKVQTFNEFKNGWRGDAEGRFM